MSKVQSDLFSHILSFVRVICRKIDVLEEKVSRRGLKNKLLWVFIALSCFLLVLLLNVLTPLISDDFAYLFIYGDDARISTIGDIVQSQINHYYMWGGRSIVHFIAQVLLLLPSCITDVLNSLIYVIYTFLIYYHIRGRGENSISLFVLINLSIWFMQPVFGDTILWITGAANYLWGTFFILLFLLPYRLYEGKELNPFRQISFSVLLFIFGIIAGWTNENTAGAMILIVILFFLCYRSSRWYVPIWGVLGLIGAVVGYAVMILAPGNFERAGSSPMSLYLMGYRLFNCTLTFFYYCGPLIMTSFVVYVLYSRFYREDRSGQLKLSMIYSIAAIAAVYAMLLAPTFPRRALFGVITYLIIGAGILFYNLDFRNSFLRQMRLGIIVLGLFSFIFTYYLAAKEINRYRNIVKQREVQIEEAKVSGKKECQFERYDGNVYIHGEDPFSAELMTRYYGITVKLQNPD
ncbi:hypothetical protein JGH11_01315 [Dysgonomonas sp. Marseille-P4677]|uniref:DUF3329 domain-containing protein n=1 Tax=Dysgonomonas sp. Marseille-P4677 TaxID=2364790 RepID=UPI0019117532|nr:DUF6056 family protein [Dysgonomonas sp. Marseille-P4677]MBK5719501.1 hypothetical protein [Dysgonomonas sp. Marseille-P4677]